MESREPARALLEVSIRSDINVLSSSPASRVLIYVDLPIPRPHFLCTSFLVMNSKNGKSD